MLNQVVSNTHFAVNCAYVTIYAIMAVPCLAIQFFGSKKVID